VVVGEVPESVDLLVVGGGPGGYVAAIRAAQLGRSVVLVDRDGEAGLGGVCLNVGCIPSKALIEVADAAHMMSRLTPAGLTAQGTVDLSTWQAWRRDLVNGLKDGIRGLLRSVNVTVQAGELRFTRPNQAVVATPEGTARYYEFTDVVIATGSRPAPLPGLVPDGRQILDSTGLLDLTEIPKRLVVVGGGYIGLELGTAFAKLGAHVTIVEAASHLLPTMDAALVRPVLARLRQLDITVLTETLAEDFDGAALRVRSRDSVQHIKADVVLVAVGRVPNTDQLGLDKLGVTPDSRGYLAVADDRRLNRHVAAIGDVTPGPALAHKASAEALVAVAALSGQRVAFQPQAIPAIVFSDPEIASAGLTESQARAEGIDPLVATFPLAASGRAATLGEKQGFVQLIADNDTKAVLGVHMVGPRASELIGQGVVAIEMGATLDDVVGVILPHPTLSEQFTEVAHLAQGYPIHVPLPRRSSSR